MKLRVSLYNMICVPSLEFVAPVFDVGWRPSHLTAFWSGLVVVEVVAAAGLLTNQQGLFPA